LTTNKPHHISVMTANLRFGLADDGNNSWDNRKESFKELFSLYQTDFIQVQESNNFQTDYLEDILKEYRFIGKRAPSPSHWQNNLIFYNKSWDCLKKSHFFLSDTPERESKWEDSTWPRQCSMGLFEKNGKQIIMINTHFDFLEEVQERSAYLILDLLKDFPVDPPVILTGDFNTIPDSPAHLVFTGNSFKDTFHSEHEPTFHGFTGEGDRGQIDWILYRGNLAVTDKQIIKNRYRDKFPSDHFPVFSQFKPIESVKHSC